MKVDEEGNMVPAEALPPIGEIPDLRA